jgi:hypothetical protein
MEQASGGGETIELATFVTSLSEDQGDAATACAKGGAQLLPSSSAVENGNSGSGGFRNAITQITVPARDSRDSHLRYPELDHSQSSVQRDRHLRYL